MTDSISGQLSLAIDKDKLDDFCKKIISRSRNTAHVHEALNVLEAFISTFSCDSHATDNYQAIQDCLKYHSAGTRDKLMQEKTHQLQTALELHLIDNLALIYTSLSRNGFYQILTTATDSFETTKVTEIAQWVIQWSEQARKKAEQASGYPDALDFKKANINIEHFQAMTDISYFFKKTYQYK